MSWNKVLNPESGYIKNDSIVLRARIHTNHSTDPNVTPDSTPESISPLTSESENEMGYDELISTCKKNNTKIQSLEAEVTELKKDLTAVLSESNTKSAELLALKINTLFVEEMLQSKFEEIDKKFNDFSNKLEKEKRVGVDVNVTINGADSNNK